MTGPEHYREAENVLKHAWDDDQFSSPSEAFRLAQVHATLALADAISRRDDTGQLVWKELRRVFGSNEPKRSPR